MNRREAALAVSARDRAAIERGAVFSYREPSGGTRQERVLHLIGCSCAFNGTSFRGDGFWEPTIPDAAFIAVPRDQARRLVRRQFARWSRTCCPAEVLA